MSLARQATRTVPANQGVAGVLAVRFTPSDCATMCSYGASSPPSKLRDRTCSFSPRMTASTRCEGMVSKGSENSK
ncbi:Uncharacterised protein [Mycobacteroides abscessus subsp. abscessus]|nr:Uncharacterised protein [Mycobacteroides abscessus subsp. abscessus]